MDAPVGVRQEQPAEAVEEEPEAAEDRQEDEGAADEERVDAPAAGEPGGDAGDPAAVVGADCAVAADAVEELPRRRVPRVGGGPRRRTEAGGGVCAVMAPPWPAEARRVSGTPLSEP